MYRGRVTRREGGFTLTELMIVVVIVAVLISIAAPGFRSLLERNRLQSAASSLFTSLMLARSEALKRNQPVVVCKSNDGADCDNTLNWEDGWIVWADANIKVGKDPNDPLIAVNDGLTTGDTLRSLNGVFANSITYKVDGSASVSGGASASDTFVLCNADKDTSTGREIAVERTGRPRINTPASDCKNL